MNQVDTIYNPSPWQQEYHNLVVNEALGAGSAGPGKTTALQAEPLPQVFVEHERCINKKHRYHINWGESKGWALYLRRTRPRQEQNIANAIRLYRAVDPDVDWNEKKGIFTFSSGYKVQYGACAEANDWINFYSTQYTLILWDELNEFEKEQYDQINSRLRSIDPVLKYMLKIRAMSNPVQASSSGIVLKDPYWVRRHFVDPAPEGRKILKKRVVLKDGSVEWLTRIYLPATLYDNPDPEFVRQYEITLRDKPIHIQKALLFGDWYVTASSYYADVWNPEYHICEPFRIPDDWRRFRSLDWGFKTTGCIGWFAIDPDGNLFCEYEYNFRGMEADLVAEQIKKIETRLGLWKNGRSGITGPADTQLWEERGDTGLTKIAEFLKAGVQWVQADKSKGSRARHAERITIRLKDHRGGTTTAGLVFFNTCVKCIQTIPAMQIDPNDPESVLKGGDDHWHDMVSYAVSYASKRRVGYSVDDINRRVNDIDEDDGVKAFEDNRGVTGYGI